tara:strand:- start:35 stop:1198 length:1164 start_codon:yes stop_codon:yes gene_type:complete
MAAINANIVVEPITLNVTDTSITQTVTVDPINLSVFTAAPSSNPPGSPNASLQFNNGNVFGGLANATVSGGNLTFTNLANLKIDGGSTGYQLTTDGAGVLSWTPGTSDPSKIINGTSNVEIASLNGNVDFTVASANVARMYTTGAAYPGFLAVNGNITAENDIESIGGNIVATAGQFTGDGNGISWTNASNVVINGGVNGYVLGTDGAGSLSWVAQGGAGTGNPGGSNTNVQFNDAGLFGGQTGFSYDKTTNVLTANVALGYGFDDVELTTTTTSNQYMFFNDFSVRYQTVDATQNADLDFRGDASTTLDTLLPVGKSITGVFVLKNGTTAYNVNTVSIDGVTQTVKYTNNITPIAAASSLNSFTFTIVKLDATPTYDVLGSATRFG